MELLPGKATLDWTRLRPQLHAGRPRPIYDSDFHRLMVDLPRYPGFTTREGVHFFVECFHGWLMGSRLNRISGLDAFPVRHVIAGVTHSLDDMHVRHGKSLVVLPREYIYHRRIRPDITVKDPEGLVQGDVLAMAIPFALYGGLHPRTREILDLAAARSVPVHIDGAWNGCLRGFEFDYDHPAIQSVSFSLSKGLGLGANRIGVRYARERLEGPVTILAENEMTFDMAMWVGICFMKRFGSDWLQNKYSDAYNLLCQEYGLKPSNAIHQAFDLVDGEWIPVGTRPFLRYLVEGYDEFAYCSSK